MLPASGGGGLRREKLVPNCSVANGTVIGAGCVAGAGVDNGVCVSICACTGVDVGVDDDCCCCCCGC